MSAGRVYGHIPGVPVGTRFKDRNSLCKAGVHGQTQAGIHGDSSEDGGAFSICLSGGYGDDNDRGEKITYVGSGGRKDGDQVADQSFEDPPNKSLEISSKNKRPVRVIRGKDDSNNWSPSEGFRYDGLYVVDSAERKPGKKGYEMCFFELRRIQEEGQDRVPYRNLLMTNSRKGR